jgi:hypothetical protein
MDDEASTSATEVSRRKSHGSLELKSFGCLCEERVGQHTVFIGIVRNVFISGVFGILSILVRFTASNGIESG